MRILITGSSGQLGKSLLNLFLNDSKSFEIIQPTRKELDLSDNLACKNIVEKVKPDWIINLAAYTLVDKAEIEMDLATQINCEAPRIFSEALSNTHGKLLHISTDYVFDGKQCRPYKPTDQRNPINSYGLSKSLGEEFIEHILFPTRQAFILRTSWLIGPNGDNFLKTMHYLHNKNTEIKVVADQVSSTTSTLTLAKAIYKIIKFKNKNINLPLIMHFSDSGVASWYDVAVAIGEIGHKLKVIHSPAKIIPIKSIEYTSPAKRPFYSLLDSSDLRKALNIDPYHWRFALEEVMKLHNFPDKNCK